MSSKKSILPSSFGIRTAVRLTIAAGVWATVLHADMSDFDRGNLAYVEGLYGEAAQFWQHAAEDGDGLAQFNLAILYEHGKGVEQDFGQAIYWYTAAAEKNVTSAQGNLANIFLTGTPGFPKNVNKAVFWYLKAADLGHADSQFSLAKLLMEGVEGHLTRDLEAAESWLQVAARNGHVEAEALLQKISRERMEERFARVRREAWVLEQPDHAWTVELYRAEDATEALTYVETIGLGEAAIVPAGAKGYAVLAGVFESETDARSAIEQLPAMLRARVPQPVAFGVVKGALAVAAGVSGDTERVQITEYDAGGQATTRDLYSDSAMTPLEAEQKHVAPVASTDESSRPVEEESQSVVSQNLTPAVDSVVSKQSVTVTKELDVQTRAKAAHAVASWTVVIGEVAGPEQTDRALSDHTLTSIRVHETLNGKYWLIHGTFATEAEAQSAFAKLPTTLRDRAVGISSIQDL